MNNFIKLTDDYIFNMARFIVSFDNFNCTDEDKNNINKLLNIIDTHSFYTLIYYNYIDMNEEDSKYYETLYKTIGISENDIIKYESVIGFISGNKNNPLDSVYLYKSKNPYNDLEILTNTDSARLLPNKYQEKLLMIFYKDKHNINILDKLNKIYN
jgi:hypothetical protein